MTSVKDPAMIVRLSLKYQDHPAQLYVDGNKMMVSSFEDDFVNVNAFDWKSKYSVWLLSYWLTEQYRGSTRQNQSWSHWS